jgi:hypothetical protein
MAEHAFGVLKLYAVEYQLSKEHLVHAVARLCVGVRETYPDGPTTFDSLAADAQARMAREG